MYVVFKRERDYIHTSTIEKEVKSKGQGYYYIIII